MKDLFLAAKFLIGSSNRPRDGIYRFVAVISNYKDRKGKPGENVSKCCLKSMVIFHFDAYRRRYVISRQPAWEVKHQEVCHNIIRIMRLVTLFLVCYLQIKASLLKITKILCTKNLLHSFWNILSGTANRLLAYVKNAKKRKLSQNGFVSIKIKIHQNMGVEGPGELQVGIYRRGCPIELEYK